MHAIKNIFYNWRNLRTFLVMSKINKMKNNSFEIHYTLTYWNSTIETLQKNVKYVEVNNKNNNKN